MNFRSFIAPALAFRTIPNTIFLVVAYVVIIASVLLTNELPAVGKADKPNNGLGLNITEAWADLHTIAARPHPYNSHANDAVRKYILSRLRAIPSVEIANDLLSNGSWASPTYATYFEGTNLLVKIDGENPDLDGVLFSAHYDSVSTASGATDDGMGVVTLLQLVRYFAQHRRKRTAIFNINNGEEDWLNGAHAFMQHPWSNLTSTFLNLEGASSGGRPLLFRSTSRKPLAAFHVKHPHANVLSADAFARGLIRSGTDYSVYTPQMQGLDLAFYTGRSRYHTKFDSIPHLEGGRRALWAMMESAWGAGLALLDAPEGGSGGDAVYFDLFAAALIVFSQKAMWIFDIVFLAIVPVVVLAERIIQRRHVTTWDWTWMRFWAALVLTAGVQAGLVTAYVWLNPYIGYSAPYLVVLSFFAISYLTLFFPLVLPGHAHAQKQTVLLQALILAYILLLIGTISLPQLGGTYALSALAGCIFLGWAVGAVEGLLETQNGEDEHSEADATGERRYVRGIRYDAIEGAEPEVPGEEIQTEPTEITPLIHQRPAQNGSAPKGDTTEGGAIGWWIVQMLLVVPIPVILISHIGIMFIGSMAQTLGDGGGVAVLYTPLAALTFLLLLPATPFIHKAHNGIAYLLAFVFVVTVVYTSGLLTLKSDTGPGFPFSQDAPVKAYFQQRVEILPSTSNFTSSLDIMPIHSKSISANVSITTYLTGVPYYLDRFLIPSLPSAATSHAVCKPEEGTRRGLTTCSWESGRDLRPTPGWDTRVMKEHKDIGGANTNSTNVPKNPWLSGSVTRLSRRSARVVLRGVNTRSCRLYFDGAKVKKYTVLGSGKETGMQQGYEIGPSGLEEVRLWSRTWGRAFVVDVEFVDDSRPMQGRLACEWAEYESGRVGGNDRNGGGGKIPALEEVLKFLPRWATVTKAADGLVEVWSVWQL
ncbi:hypothetical protein BDZ94DRAFT_1321670 [Collybia nuda]|uniref:Peptide hydrolase n=1 Tax=Collybia nuda TaxID=64659 RepID=A0A9P5Y766_9AGAR|nr:hypothetical protein BDZ94DRAFT_1321670 [Collybia nuda]